MHALPPIPDCDPSEWELDEAFGEHNIEYWVWSGKRLVPATAEQLVTIHEIEERLHLTRRQSVEESASQQANLAPGRSNPGHGMTLVAAHLLALLRHARPQSSDTNPT